MAASQSTERTRHSGVYRVHRRGCRWQASKRACKCPSSFQATVYSKTQRKQLRKHFDNVGAAVAWRQDVSSAVRAGKVRVPSKRLTIAQAADELIAGMEDGSILNRSQERYKASAIRGYRRALDKRVKPELGHRPLHQLERSEIQEMVGKLRAEGLAPSTIVNTLDPLRVICRRAVRDNLIVVDPTAGLELPRVKGRRQRIERPERAQVLLDALSDAERPLWTCAFFAGLRRGELRALRWSDIDLDASVIRVRRSLDDDPEVGEIEVKTDAGERDVPLIGRLRRELLGHRLATGRSGNDFVFGRTADAPFTPSTVRRRALKAWENANERLAEQADEGREVDPDELLTPITPHEARHCAASYLIASGLNPKEISVYIGHSDIRTTYNVYGHLLPGGHEKAVSKLDAFFDDAGSSDAS